MDGFDRATMIATTNPIQCMLIMGGLGSDNWIWSWVMGNWQKLEKGVVKC